MWFKKHWKGLLTSIITLGVVGTSLAIFLWPKNVTPINNYILKFNENGPNAHIAKQANQYLDNLKKEVHFLLDTYEKVNPNFKDLTLDFINLKTVQTDGEKNFFFSLDRTLKAIDDRLGFNNIQRTPATVNQGFYNKDTELLSFYWSPDYNGVGTWLKYMFSDDFSIPNFWPAIYEQCMQGRWPSLKSELSKSEYGFADGNSGQVFTLFHNQPEILQFVNNPARNISKVTISGFYVSIANIIGKWVGEHSTIDLDVIHKSSQQVDANNNLPDGYYLKGYNNMGEGIELVNFISSNPVSIPFVEDGYKTETPWLLRKGFYNQQNPNTDVNYRDWFMDSSINTSNVFRIWVEANPFLSNQTPFNPSFSNAPSSSFFQTIWTGLTSWTTIGYEDSEIFPYSGDYLVMNGSTSNIEDVKNEFNSQKTMTFKIRPIPWVDVNGNQISDGSSNYYLSPADFLATIKAFIRSTQTGVNSNAYFIDLLGIDIERTINDPNNALRNNSLNDQKEFKIYFKIPTLSAEDCLDILQKQYFVAIPSFKQSVKNIINDADWNRVAVINPETGLLDMSKTNMNEFYGSGDWRKNWTDLCFVSPYYISKVSEQNIIFNLNKSYFDAFKNDINKPEYKSFKLVDGSIKKIPQINVKYAGSYSDNILFEQFKSNELDLSPVQSSNILNVVNNYKNDLTYVKVQKLSKSNLVGYNLQVFPKSKEGYILDQNNNPLIDPSTGLSLYGVDKFGNYKLENLYPKLKPHVSQEYYDLIVRNFFTPINATNVNTDANHLNDNEKNKLLLKEQEVMNKSSIILRSAINNCINWVSLKTLVFPGISKSIQYSFMPYGVYQMKAKINEIEYVSDNQINKNNIYTSKILDDFKKYWFLAASKKLQNEVSLNNRILSGSIYWSYDELLNNIIR